MAQEPNQEEPVNFIHIAGHLGADPETRFTSNGKKVTTLRVACRTRKGQNEDTIWWRVTIWGEQYDKMIPYFKKGSSIMVAGEMHKPEIFTDKEGKPQPSMEITAHFIQFSPFGKPGGASGEGQQQQVHAQVPGAPAAASGYSAPTSPYMPGSMTSPKGDTFDDEVPF
jgi:single-strand DNA-binding protein